MNVKGNIMTILKTKATYRNGVVIPKTRPSFGKPDKVFVTFVKLGSTKPAKKGNALATLEILKSYAGTLPKNFPSGTSYIAKLRKKLSKEWEEHLVK